MKTLFIVNPISGRGGRKAGILSLLRSSGCEIAFTEYAGHAEQIAAGTEADTVVAVGGDGTLNEVARGILGAYRNSGVCKTLGILPCGSGDGLARMLGLHTTAKKGLEIIRRGKTQPLDCAEIDGRPFFSVCGVGLDAIVSEDFAKAGKRGLVTYINEAVKEWGHFRPEHYVLEIDGRTIERDAVLITVANSNQWGNEARVTPLASVCDSLLDITVVSMFRTMEIPLLAAELMTGHFDRNRHVECLQGKEIAIHRETEGPAHCDGDCITAGRDVRVRLLPERLRILVP